MQVSRSGDADSFAVSSFAVSASPRLPSVRDPLRDHARVKRWRMSRRRVALWLVEAAVAVVVFLPFLLLVDNHAAFGSGLALAVFSGIAARQLLVARWSRADSAYRLERAIQHRIKTEADAAEFIGSLWGGSVWVPLVDPPPTDLQRWLSWRRATSQHQLTIRLGSLEGGDPVAAVYVHTADIPRDEPFVVLEPLPDFCEQISAIEPAVQVAVVSAGTNLTLSVPMIEAITSANRVLKDGRSRRETEHAAVQAIDRALTPPAES